MLRTVQAIAVAGLIAAPLASNATPIYQTFGPLPQATFGGQGIPNDAVAASGVFENGVNLITLGLTAHQRYSNPALTNNGAGVFYAGPGSNCGTPTDPVGCPSVNQGALWNFAFYVEVAGPTADLADYDFKLYYDFDPGANTGVGSLGVIDLNNSIIALGGNPAALTVAQDSQNLLFSFLGSCAAPPVVTPPGGCPTPLSFNPNALGEYSFYLTAFTKGAFPASVGTVGIDVQIVPVPAAAWLFGSALGLLGVGRRLVP